MSNIYQILSSAKKNKNSNLCFNLNDIEIDTYKLNQLIDKLKIDSFITSNNTYIKILHDEYIQYKYNDISNDITYKYNSVTPNLKLNIINNQVKHYFLQLYIPTIIKNNLLNKVKKYEIETNYEYILNNYPDWRINIYLIKQIQNITDYHNKPIINYDFINIHVTYIGNILDLKSNSIFDCVNVIYKLLKNKSFYQSVIYDISKLIYTDSKISSRFKYKSGFKQLTNNVIELNRNDYHNILVPNINQFYLTDKIDGQRCLLIIVQKSKKLEINLLSNKLYFLNTTHEVSNFDLKNNKVSIFDAEFIYNDTIINDILDESKIQINIFDVLMYNSTNYCQEPFEIRYKLFKEIPSLLQKINNCKVKDFISLTTNYKEEIKEFYKQAKAKDYEIDGLIFTPSSYMSNIMINQKMESMVNTQYYNLISYKWKPEDKLSIDFYIAKIPDNIIKKNEYKNFIKPNEQLYILCSGVTGTNFDKLVLELCPYYYDIIDEKYHSLQYFPIQFSPDDNKNIYIWSSTNTNLHNQVGEFIYKNNKFILERVREDRQVEIERGNYWGNNYKYAEMLWYSIKNPLTFDQLLIDNNTYFSETSLEKYIPQRGFNSFVKTHIIKEVKHDKNWIIDLCSGKGQNMKTWIDLGFKNILMVDNDKDAIYQSIQRKHNFIGKHQEKSKIYINELNVSNDLDINIHILNNIPIFKEQADIIICNFAIHYMLQNETHIKNLIDLVKFYLKPNGKFIYTCFNGSTVFDKLKNNNKYDLYEKKELKYSIHKKYTEDKLLYTNQAIDVLLPFSNNRYYTEYLVNNEYMNTLLTNSNMILEKLESFNTLFEQFKKNNNKVYNQLTDSDKEYLSLYQYVIYTKL